MANKAEKNREARNLSLLYHLLTGILLVHLIYVPVRVWWFSNSFSGFHWFGFASTSLVILVSFYFLWSAHKRGLDLGLQGSVLEYLQDLIYVGLAVLVMTIFSDWFFLLWLVVAIYAFYKLWTQFLAPWIFEPAPEEEEMTSTRKVRKNKQRFAARR
eukprot:m.484027 g.484027  ORF g.484027 m.484027 type:complete len:157 (-) comp23157_c0_seq1:72-542(-)